MSVALRSQTPDDLDRAGRAAARTGAGWTADTSMTAWCETCGADVEFVAPAGVCPADLAADERGCVWCGEALTVSVGVRVGGCSSGAAG